MSPLIAELAKVAKFAERVAPEIQAQAAQGLADIWSTDSLPSPTSVLKGPP